MARITACPEMVQYERLAAGRLAEADKDTLLDHLEHCDTCAQKMRALPEPDRLVSFLRQADTLGKDSGTLLRLVEHLDKLRPGEPQPGVEQTLAPQEPVSSPLLKFACSACGKSVKVKVELAGKKVKCPYCKEPVRVPANAVGTMAPAAGSGQEKSTVGGVNSLSRVTDSCADQPRPVDAKKKEQYDFLAPPQAPDELGRLGPYRVLQVLGAGGMGVVFRAEDPQLQRLVALKAMLPSLAASDSAKQRFLREARAAAALKHDHIVTIHQVGEDRGAPFLAMEFLEGEPLDVRLEREGKLPLGEVLRIGREMAEGLAAAHERGLIHRDIKPANVWLEGKKGRVKILDFGLARAVGQENQLTQQGAIIGTPAYMAPEQGQGLSLDFRCDLFSLGCVLYRVATGKAAFGGTDIISTLMAVATEKPRPPHELEPGLPAALSELIMSLVAKWPEDRPVSAQAVAETLEGIARESSSGSDPGRIRSAKNKGRSKGKGRPASDRRRRWVLALVIVLVLGFGCWLLAPIVFRTRVRTVHGEAFVVLEIEQAGAEVFVDGDRISVTVPGDNKPVEIRVEPGQHKLRISKDGFVAVTRDVELKTGKSDAIRVRLEPVPKEAPKVVQATVPADALRRADIPEAVLASIGGGDPKRAPPELVAVLGDGRFRLTGASRSPAFSPDGALLAVPNGGEVFLFDANSGQLLRRFRGHAGRICSVAFSPDGAVLAMGDQTIVRLLNPRNGVVLHDLAGHSNFIVGLAFTADNKTILSGSEDSTVRVWDVTKGRQTQALSCKAGVNSVAITPDGRLAVAGSFDGRVYGWSSLTGAEEFVLEPGKQAPVTGLGACVSISADGKSLASGTNSRLKVWQIADLSKKNPAPFFEKQTPAGWLQFEKTSNKLWMGEQNQHTTDNQARCFDTASKQFVSSVTLRTATAHWVAYALSPDDRTLVAFGHFDDCVVHLYDTQTGKPRFPDSGHTRDVNSVAFSPDGRWLASGSADNTVRVWDLATGTQRHKMEGHTATVWSLAFSPDGKLLASGSLDGTIALWDSATGTRMRTHNGYVAYTPVRFSPDGKLVAACTADGGLRMWSTRNGEEARMLRGLHEGNVHCLAFSADGQRLATGGWDGKLVITDLASGKVIQSLPKRNTAVNTVDFGTDGETVAAGYNHPEPVVRVWNLKDKDFVSLSGHTSNLHTVSLRSDGRLAVSASDDGSVRLWEIGGNLPRKMVLGLGTVGEKLWTAALSPDGRYVATGNSNGTIYLFRLPRPAENIGEWLAARGTPPRGLSQEAWLERVKGLYVGNVADAVTDRIRELNPGFAGPVATLIEDGVVTVVRFEGNVKDITPLRALPGLRTFGCANTPLADLSQLKGMNLTNLEIWYSGAVSDLSPLKGMKLTVLFCFGTQVSDLTPVKDMKLTVLKLNSAQLTDAGLMPLETMSSLRVLEIVSPKMTDAGLAHLEKLTELGYLSIHKTKVTGSGLVHLKGMAKLQTLYLGDTEVTDAGLVHLKGLLGLHSLNLPQTRVTDAGLEHLTGLKNLAELNLKGTAVTDKGVAKLKAALPKCNITR